MEKIRYWVKGNISPEDYTLGWIDTSDPAHPLTKIADNGTWKTTCVPEQNLGAVLYTEQSLTDAQKMQARKNQGLYYSETVPARTISWDGETEGREVVTAEIFAQEVSFVKVLDSFVEPEGLSSMTLSVNGSPTVRDLDAYDVQIENGSWVLGDAAVLCFSEQATYLGQTFTEGLYFASYVSSNGGSTRVVSLSWASYTTCLKVESKYLPISTNIATDATSDTKVASPKAVKTYVDGAIPTVPTISTNITTDATSDTKTASPKAVKTYVDNLVGNIETLLGEI